MNADSLGRMMRRVRFGCVPLSVAAAAWSGVSRVRQHSPGGSSVTNAQVFGSSQIAAGLHAARE